MSLFESITGKLPLHSHERGHVIRNPDKLPTADDLYGPPKTRAARIADVVLRHDPDADFMLPGDAAMLSNGHLPGVSEPIIKPVEGEYTSAQRVTERPENHSGVRAA